MALEDVAHRLGTDCQAEVGQGADNPIIAPGTVLVGHADHQVLQLGSTVGRPGALRWAEPSNFWATSVRCQPRIVSGLTIVATSAGACFPSLRPMPASASVRRHSTARVL